MRIAPSCCKSINTLAVIGFLLFSGIQSSHAEGTSHDQAEQRVAKMIAGSPRLTQLDNEMKALYRRIESETAGVDGETGKPINHVKDEQLIWVNATRNTCKSLPCMESAYRKRIAEMKSKWKEAL